MSGSVESPATEEVLTEIVGKAGVITLNRPAALNAVTHDMVRAMTAALLAWRDDPRVSRVIIRQTGEKAFAAGGDLRRLYDDMRAGAFEAVATFFRDEYRLNRLIKRYPKPYIALIDGIVMGGGVGVSFHGSHRVASEFVTFAMPEVGIGFFPDVGATYFLSRLPGQVGLYLGLTGERLKIGDLMAVGLATHHVPRAAFGRLAERLTGGEDVDAAIAACAIPAPDGALADRRARIDEWFGAGDLEAAVAAVEAAAGGGDDLAAGILRIVAQRSPTSLAIAHRQIVAGRTLQFEDCMRLEFRIVSRIVHGHDFAEGIRAVIVDKDNAPRWRPATLAAVDRDALDAHFAPLAAGELDFPE